MGISIIGLILGLLVLALIVGGIVFAVGSLPKFRFGHAKLNCPHCDAETPAHLGTCQQCGKDL